MTLGRAGFYLDISVRSCQTNLRYRHEDQNELIIVPQNITDRLLPGDSKRVLSPRNRQMLAAFHALFAT